MGAASAAKKSKNAYEFNPRWNGYIYIMLSSLINYASIANVNERGYNEYEGSKGASLLFGIITFVASLAILAFDNCQSYFWKFCFKGDGDDGNKKADKYNYTKAFDGKLEGGILVCFTFWWIIGCVNVSVFICVDFLCLCHGQYFLFHILTTSQNLIIPTIYNELPAEWDSSRKLEASPIRHSISTSVPGLHSLRAFTRWTNGRRQKICCRLLN